MHLDVRQMAAVGVVDERTDPRVERTREAVVATVRRLLAKEGAPSVTPQRVSSETGISRSTLHRHWPDIRALLVEALAEPDPVADVPLLGDLRLDLGVDLHQLRLRLNDPEASPLLVTVLAEASFDPGFGEILRTHAASHLERLGRVLEGAQASGHLRADIEPEDAAAHLAGPIFFRRFFLQQEITTEFVDAVIDAFVVAHSPHPEGTSP